jgi:hypothetical protein
MSRVPLVFACALLAASSAGAQEAGQVGVSMGFPTSVGLLVHVTDGVAVRPEVTFQHSSTERALSEDDASSTSVSFGATGLFYVGEWDNLRTYVGPRYLFSHSSFSSDDSAFDSSISAHSIAGLFGAQYTPHRRFSVFGEVGLEYVSSSSENDFLDSSRDASSFGLHSAVGVVFYFK